MCVISNGKTRKRILLFSLASISAFIKKKTPVSSKRNLITLFRKETFFFFFFWLVFILSYCEWYSFHYDNEPYCLYLEFLMHYLSIKKNYYASCDFLAGFVVFLGYAIICATFNRILQSTCKLTNIKNENCYCKFFFLGDHANLVI